MEPGVTYCPCSRVESISHDWWRERSDWPDPGSKPFSVSQPGPQDPQVNLWLLRFLHVFTGTKTATLKKTEHARLLCIFKKEIQGSVFHQKEIKPCLSPTRGITVPSQVLVTPSTHKFGPVLLKSLNWTQKRRRLGNENKKRLIKKRAEIY